MCSKYRRLQRIILLVCFHLYSRTPLIRKLVIRLANYPDRLGPSVKYFLILIALHVFLWLKFFPPSYQIHITNYVLMFYLYVNKYVA